VKSLKTAQFLIYSLVLMTLASCGFMIQPSGENSVYLSMDDEVADIPRDMNTVKFDTFVSVSLDLNVGLAVGEGISGGRFLYAELPEAIIIATVTDENGHMLYRGKVDGEGRIEGRFHVPTSADFVTLTLEGPGIGARRVVIDQPAALDAVVRTMGIVESSAGSSARSAANQPDIDGDGIPDSYDVAPLNETIAFATRVPAVDLLTVAFEDNFPGVGDGDYNDFVATLALAEFRSGEDTVAAVGGIATARVKVSGYDHEFGLTLDLLARNTDPDVVDPPLLVSGVLDSHGYPLEENESSIPMASSLNDGTGYYRVRIPFFQSTRGAFGSEYPLGEGLFPDANPGHVGWFLLILDESGGYNLPLTAPYDPYLYIHNTGYDVHLVGRTSLDGSSNPAGSDGFVDGQGFPRGLLLPVEWSPPKELNDIRNAYPRFSAWMAELSSGIRVPKTLPVISSKSAD
jgi:hypothetical protein